MAYDFRSGGYVKFVRCVTAAWNSLATKDNDTLYFVYESNASTGLLYLGNRLISGSVSSTFSLSDLQDVLISSGMTSNSLLVYDNVQDKWVNKTLNEVFEEIASSIMVGATESADGLSGLVPVPHAGEQDLFLRGDATWANPTAAVELRVGALETSVGNLEDSLAVIQGSDTTKSMREVAREEVAAIVDGADASFDTLKEIAEWISTHEDTADIVSLQNDVKDLKDLIYDIPEELDPVTGEVITPASVGLETRVGDLEDALNGADGLASTVDSLQTDLVAVDNKVDDLDALIRGSGATDPETGEVDNGLIGKVDELDGRLKWQDLVESESSGD